MAHPVGFNTFDLPIGVLTDSYKATHYDMYPDAKRMSAYGEFRAPFQGNETDHRFISYGIRYIIEHFVAKRWTLDDVHRSELFLNTHGVGGSKFPFPTELFVKFVKENDGYFPVKIEALPEGTVVHIHTPVYQILAEKEYSKLVTFLETLLTMVWYPTTVATLSRMTKDSIAEGFHKSVDDDAMFLLDSRLHDFGFRGCTSVEQSVIGGSAHLLNFTGSDTMSACYYTQYVLNNGKPVGSSIPATEHSVMTAWKTETQAISHMIEKFGGGIFATVMDSYDYDRALFKIVPSLAEQQKKKGGLWVFRPDSGDPVEAILAALKAGEQAFGTTKNKKGYKVIKGAACIQGDGINMKTVKLILDAALKEGFSAQNVAFGMGGGLLQKVNRDTMSFATKLSFIEYADGSVRDVMKLPKTDTGKTSLPGILRVKRDPKTGLEVVTRRDPSDHTYDHDDLLRPVYDMRPIPNFVWDDFDTVRNRVKAQWEKAPKVHDPVSKEIKDRIVTWVADQKKLLAEEKL